MSDAPITREQIKAARKLLGWSQSTLAGRVHMSAARIRAIETGKQQPSAFELDLIREALESAGVELGDGPGVRLRKSDAKGSIGLQSNETTLERGFELARSGKYRTIRELIQQLSSEGYSAEQVEGKQVRTQLLRLMRAPKAEADPVAENGEGGRTA